METLLRSKLQGPLTAGTQPRPLFTTAPPGEDTVALCCGPPTRKAETIPSLSSRYWYDAASGYYYDANTGLYFHPTANQW